MAARAVGSGQQRGSMLLGGALRRARHNRGRLHTAPVSSHARYLFTGVGEPVIAASTGECPCGAAGSRAASEGQRDFRLPLGAATRSCGGVSPTRGANLYVSSRMGVRSSSTAAMSAPSDELDGRDGAADAASTVATTPKPKAKPAAGKRKAKSKRKRVSTVPTISSYDEGPELWAKAQAFVDFADVCMSVDMRKRLQRRLAQQAGRGEAAGSGKQGTRSRPLTAKSRSRLVLDVRNKFPRWSDRLSDELSFAFFGADPYELARAPDGRMVARAQGASTDGGLWKQLAQIDVSEADVFDVARVPHVMAYALPEVTQESPLAPPPEFWSTVEAQRSVHEQRRIVNEAIEGIKPTPEDIQHARAILGMLTACAHSEKRARMILTSLLTLGRASASFPSNSARRYRLYRTVEYGLTEQTRVALFPHLFAFLGDTTALAEHPFSMPAGLPPWQSSADGHEDSGAFVDSEHDSSESDDDEPRRRSVTMPSTLWVRLPYLLGVTDALGGDVAWGRGLLHRVPAAVGDDFADPGTLEGGHFHDSRVHHLLVLRDEFANATQEGILAARDTDEELGIAEEVAALPALDADMMPQLAEDLFSSDDVTKVLEWQSIRATVRRMCVILRKNVAEEALLHFRALVCDLESSRVGSDGTVRRIPADEKAAFLSRCRALFGSTALLVYPMLHTCSVALSVADVDEYIFCGHVPGEAAAAAADEEAELASVPEFGRSLLLESGHSTRRWPTGHSLANECARLLNDRQYLNFRRAVVAFRRVADPRSDGPLPSPQQLERAREEVLQSAHEAFGVVSTFLDELLANGIDTLQVAHLDNARRARVSHEQLLEERLEEELDKASTVDIVQEYGVDPDLVALDDLESKAEKRSWSSDLLEEVVAESPKTDGVGPWTVSVTTNVSSEETGAPIDSPSGPGPRRLHPSLLNVPNGMLKVPMRVRVKLPWDPVDASDVSSVLDTAGSTLKDSADAADAKSGMLAATMERAARTVFVSSLPLDSTEWHVRAAFAACGKIKSCSLLRDRLRGPHGTSSVVDSQEESLEEHLEDDGAQHSTKPRNRRHKHSARRVAEQHKTRLDENSVLHAFVEFETEEGARLGASDVFRLFGAVINGKPCRTQAAAEKRVLYIGGFPTNIPPHAARLVMKQVLSHMTEQGYRTSMIDESRLSASAVTNGELFVEFDTHEEARVAEALLQGLVVSPGSSLVVGWASGREWDRARPRKMPRYLG